MAVLADAILTSAEGGEANNDNNDNALGGERGNDTGWMIMTTMTTMAMMGRTEIVVVIAAADVCYRS